jgi:hypothetical protein
MVATALMLTGILAELRGKEKRPRHKEQASDFRLARLLGRRWRCEGCFQDNSFAVTRCAFCDRIAPGAGWSCAVCEAENSLSDAFCRECSVPRPEEDFQ